MNSADYVILGIVGISVILSWRKGFVSEAFSLATWVGAFIVAKLFSHSLALLSGDLVNPPSLRVPVASIVLFVATLIIGSLVQRLLSELVKVTGLSATDRMLGMLFGGIRGLLIVTVSLGFLSRLTEMPHDPWWRTSVLIPELMQFEAWATELAKDSWGQINKLTS